MSEYQENLVSSIQNSYLGQTSFGITSKLSNQFAIHISWWVPIVIAICTWTVGAAICWAQGGRVAELGWFSVRCVR